jgi:hypothetical protein
VLARLDAGQSEWLSELRLVSACFIAIPGLDDTEGGEGERGPLGVAP